MLADIGSIEKRMERLEKDLKKLKNPGARKGIRATCSAPKPGWNRKSRCAKWKSATKNRKLVKGFAFLSEKPMIYVENIGEDQLDRLRHPDAHERVASEHRADDHLRKTRSGNGGIAARRVENISRGLWTDRVRRRTLDPHDVSSARIDFIFYRRRRRMPRLDDHARNERAECRRRDPYRSCRSLHSRGSLPLRRFRETRIMQALKEKGLLRLEGKEYIVKDGDIMTIRHSG